MYSTCTFPEDQTPTANHSDMYTYNHLNGFPAYLVITLIHQKYTWTLPECISLQTSVPVEKKDINFGLILGF